MEPLDIRNLCKSFNQGEAKTDILRDVSLNAKDGEFISVMGPSGSGKSTLLHLIAGLIEADSGEILLNGDDITKMNDGKLTAIRREKIGFVFQSFNLIPSLDVYDNIVLPVLSGGKSVDQNMLDDMLEELDIADKVKRYPDSLSGGEQQRVAIARALLQSPDVVLADEPTGSLDTLAGQQLCKILRRICDVHKRTIVMVTHEPSVAAWADRVLVLMDGQFVAELGCHGADHAQELAAQYQSLLEKHIKTV